MVKETSTADHFPKLDPPKPWRTGLNCPIKIRVAFETNGKGWLGYVEELPGAFVRGSTQEDCLTKVKAEIHGYLGWLGIVTNDDADVSVSRIVQSDLRVEDADNRILLDTDRAALGDTQFRTWSEIALYSAVCFEKLYTSASQKEWQDPARIRQTFLGDCPASIDDIHVDRVQGYYLQCLGLEHRFTSDAFVERRRECLSRISDTYAKNTGVIEESEGESWTIAKALRRFIWHDRIHAKSIVRTLQRLQTEFGAIDDPFSFGQLDTTVRTELIKK
jgi:hypothetical protein